MAGSGWLDIAHSANISVRQLTANVAGAPDVAKPTPHPDRGHRRRCDHFRCYRCIQRRQSGVQLVQPQLESALVIAEWPASKPEPLRCARQRHLPCSSCQSTAHRMAGTAGLDCHGRLACTEAMRATIMGSPFAPLALHFIWHISRQLALRMSP